MKPFPTVLNALVFHVILVLFITACNTNIDPVPESKATGWVLHDNGSFDLTYGELLLKGGYPRIDDRQVIAARVSVRRNSNGGSILYSFNGGRIRLELGEDAEGYFIRSRLEGFRVIPDWFCPLGGALVKGADRFYRQGFGFAGSSGVFRLPEPEKRIEQAVLKENTWSYDSYLFTGLISPFEDVLVFSALDHSDYQHRSTLYNRQHRHGLIDRHLDTDRVMFESGFALEGTGSGEMDIELPEIRIRSGKGVLGVLQEMAHMIADYNQVELSHPPRYYYCSWYEFKRDFNEEILEDLIKGSQEMDTGIQVQSIQIDDGYAERGDWLNTRKTFPSGLSHAAEVIQEAGYAPGIWVGPFMVSSRSFIYKEHPDWILRDANGEMMLEWKGEEEDTYILDSSHPEAFAYLREVFRTLREMGFTMYKTDFMDWGLQDSRRVRRHTPGKTSVQYYNDVVEMIREEIGEESYWLGCISPFQQMIGYADGIRVGNDVGDRWGQETTVNMFNEMYAGHIYNNILWQNDPDVLYLRDYSTNLSASEKISIALFDGMMGGTITTSCRFHTLEDENLRLWKFLQPGDSLKTPEIPGWGIRPDVIPVLRRYPARKAAGLLLVNTSERAVEEVLEVGDLTGMNNPWLFEWGPEITRNLGRKISHTIALPPHTSRLFWISENDDGPGTAGIY